MADQVEPDLRDDAAEKTVSYPLRKWWRPYWLSPQGLDGTHLQDLADLCWAADRPPRALGRCSGRPWPECTSSPLIVPLHPGGGSGAPPGPGAGQAELYKWRVVLDVAHFAPPEIWIGTTGGVLEVKGTHIEKPDEHGSIARCFTRKYRLPEGVDLSKITSTLSADGIMFVEVPLAGFTVPADIIIPIQVEREVAEPRQGEEIQAAHAAPPEAGPSAPGEPGREVAEPLAEEADHGEASQAGEGAEAEASGGEPPQHDAEGKQEEQEEEEKKEEVKEGEEELNDEEKAKEKDEEVKEEGEKEEVKELDEEVKEKGEEVKEQEAPGEASEGSSSAAGPGEGPDSPPEPLEPVEAPGGGPGSPEHPGSRPSDQEEAGDSPEPGPGESSGEAPQTEEPAEGQSP